MGTFFICMIKSAICLVVFYLFYKLLLSRDTFHRFNRIALLSLMLLSFVVPLAAYLFQPTKLAGVVDLDALLLAGNATVVLNAPVKVDADQSILWIQVLLLVYLVGILVCFIRQAFSLTGMLKLMKASRQQSGDGYALYVHDKKIAPFSWMKRIVVSNNDLNANEEKILAHEWAHIRLRHSWDLLLVDICLSFQWFNPASWLVKQELQSIHEFEADDVVLRQGIDAKQYQLLLIEKAVGTRLYSMANSFNHSSLKKRITMMLKEKSNPWARLKYLYVLPLTCVTVLAFARPEVSTIEQQSTRKIDESVALATTKIGNFATDKSTEISVMNNSNGIKNKDRLLAQAYSKPTVIQIAEVKETTEGSTTTNAWSTTGNSMPLIVVNGSPYAVFLGPNDDYLRLDPEKLATLLSIKPDDITGITVLKDAAATAVWGARGAKGVIQITTKKDVPISTTDISITDKPDQSTSSVKAINIAETMPQFPGGDGALVKYLQESLHYPTSAFINRIEGRVVCNFVVTTEGDVVDVKVVRGVSPELDSEAMRVILNMPDWTPGRNNGEKVNVFYTLPIVFKLNKGNSPPPPPLNQGDKNAPPPPPLRQGN